MDLLRIWLLVLGIPCLAEYRAFWHKIYSPTQTDFRTQISNLDQNQFRYYMPLRPGEELVAIDTWMCRNRTSDFRPICDSPRKIQIEKSLADEKQLLEKKKANMDAAQSRGLASQTAPSTSSRANLEGDVPRDQRSPARRQP